MVTEPISICEAILKRHGATEIYVFGSHAKGTATSESDLDLAVTGIDELSKMASVLWPVDRIQNIDFVEGQ